MTRWSLWLFFVRIVCSETVLNETWFWVIDRTIVDFRIMLGDGFENRKLLVRKLKTI